MFWVGRNASKRRLSHKRGYKGQKRQNLLSNLRNMLRQIVDKNGCFGVKYVHNVVECPHIN